MTLTPEQIKLLIYAAIVAVVLAAAGYAGWTLQGWRLAGQIQQLEREKQSALDQGAVLAGAVSTCNASVGVAKEASAAAIAFTRGALDEVGKHLAGQRAAVKRLEDLFNQPTPSGFDCRQAWKAIEAARQEAAAATSAVDRKAGSP